MEKSDRIVILKISKITRIYRTIKRSIIERIKRKRKESFYSVIKMIKWGIEYDKKILPEIFSLTKEFKNKIIILKSNKEINNYLEKL